MTNPTPEAPFELPAGCDASAPWAYDPMHFPRPFPPLGQEALRSINQNAFGLETAFSHGYAFTKDFTPPPPTQEVLEKGVVRIWEDEFVPRIEEFCERVRAADYDSLTAEALAARLPGIINEAGDIFRYTMIVVFPFMGPTLHLVEASEQALGPDGPLLVASLLQGYANETSSAGTGLGELTSLASTMPDVSRALRDGNYDLLPTVSGGPEFLKAFDAYLAKYGWRVDDWGQFHVGTWAENPETPLRMISAFLAGDAGNPDASIRRAAELREAAERELRSRLSGETLEQILGMLEVARPHVAMSEGRARWQLTIVGSLRAPVLALGRKLQAAGALADPNDAFFLSSEELQAAARSPSPATLSVVEQRKKEHAHARTLQPPPFLGAMPDMAGAPPEVQSVFRRFFGLGVAPSDDAMVLMGNAASKGVVRGRARIIRDLDEADRLEPGDILVCTLTAPPWTPLFAIAGAVVTDTGGVLSHSAICAREFAIPCVVGTQVGTSVIPDGSYITVDGDKGTVRMER